jgi:hypothetical protein
MRAEHWSKFPGQLGLVASVNEAMQLYILNE